MMMGQVFEQASSLAGGALFRRASAGNPVSKEVFKCVAE